jgi:hypothetical protein
MLKRVILSSVIGRQPSSRFLRKKGITLPRLPKTLP